jgi:hypothetical protein
MRIARCSFAVLLVSAAAVAQTDSSPLYRSTEFHFAVIFPGIPMARDVAYTTKDGMSRLARQFYIEQALVGTP